MPGGAFELQGGLVIDLSEVEALPAELQRALAGAGGKETSIRVGLQSGQAKSQLTDLQRQVTTLGKSTAKPAITIDGQPALQTLGNVRADLDKTVEKIKNAKNQMGGGGKGGGAIINTDEIMNGIMMMGMSGLGGVGAKEMLTGAFTSAGQENRMESNLGRQFGAGGQGMVDYGNKLSGSTGYSKTDILQTMANMQAMGDQFGITNDQITQMTTAVTGLARTSALPQYMDNLEAVTTSLEQGLNGNARGMKLLGIQVSDDYMKNVYLNGSLKKTWDTMSMGEQMQQRFQAIMGQVGDRMNAASTDGNSLAHTMSAAKTAMHEAEVALGEGVIPVVTFFAKTLTSLPKPLIEAGVALGAIVTSAMGLMLPAMAGRSLYKAGKSALGKMKGGVEDVAEGGTAGPELQASATELQTAAAQLQSAATQLEGAAAQQETSATTAATAQEAAATTQETAATTAATVQETAAEASSVAIEGAATSSSVALDTSAASLDVSSGALDAAAASLEAAAVTEGISGGVGGMGSKFSALAGGGGGMEAAAIGGEGAAAAEGGFASMIPGLTAGGLAASTALLAIPAALDIGLIAYLKHIASGTQAATDQTNKNVDEGVELEQIKTAKLTGMGNANDPRQAAYVATSWKFEGNHLDSFNAAGQRLSASVEKWQQSERAGGGGGGVGQQISVTIQDRTKSGVAATDVGSYASPNR